MLQARQTLSVKAKEKQSAVQEAFQLKGSFMRLLSDSHGLAAWASLLAILAGLGAYGQEPSDKAPSAQTLCSFDKPFQYSYMSWKDKAKVEEGKAILRSLGANGGAGSNEDLNLAGKAAFSPALKLRAMPGNTAKTIRFLLRDAAETSAIWEFALPPPSSEFSTVTPARGAPLSKPSVLEGKGDAATPLAQFNLSQIKGWQLLGNWQAGTLDVEVEEILLLTPDASILAQREAADKEDAENAKRLAERAAKEAALLAKEKEEMTKKYSARGDGSPVAEASMIAPDILSLAIEAQRVVLPKLERYVPQDGDEKRIEKWSDGTVRRAKLVRGGKEAGWLQGRNLDYFSTFESLEGDPLLYFLADSPANYGISSEQDPAYASAQQPAAVFRKSLPADQQLGSWPPAFPMRHNIYLKLPHGLSQGKAYRVSISSLNVKNPSIEFVYDARSLRSEAVHVNQIGYRPDDPGKRAFLSAWLGTGGAFTYPEGLRFSLIDEASGKDVFEGLVELALAANGTERLWVKAPKNYSGTAVYKMDFGGFKTPGRYRVHVQGVGCSYPFEIGPSVWEKAFTVQMRGLFNNRSGIELGEPYTKFKKPRDFNPADGAVVTRSTYDVLSGGNEAFKEIAKGDTGEPVPEAWGGYHDAGDWNPRRVSHMAVTMAQLELMELFPSYFSSVKLNIAPEERIPDVLTEALFAIDCFRRLQLPDGGIPYGIETEGDPLAGEISWLSTQHTYMLAPNMRDSWLYAAVAARAAKALKAFKPELAAVYKESAEKAFAWAEADHARRKADGSISSVKELWKAIDNRNLAALLLYGLTGDPKYHDAFRQDTCLNDPAAEPFAWGKHVQCDAAFIYARLDDAKADPAIKSNAIAAVMKQAGRSLGYAAGNVFSLTHEDKGKPLFNGFFSVSGGTGLARAHFLSGKPEYLEGAIRSCQFQSGCNPNNIVYTTGLGANPVKHPLHLDSRSTGQPPPEGLTVYGNVDYWNWKGRYFEWSLPNLSKPSACCPNPYQWPLEEAYFDMFMYVSMNEFTVDTWAPNIFVWGYLAARPAQP